jgi:hypothetical protein
MDEDAEYELPCGTHTQILTAVVDGKQTLLQLKTN